MEQGAERDFVAQVVRRRRDRRRRSRKTDRACDHPVTLVRPHSAHSSFPPVDAPGSRSITTPHASAHACTRCRPRPLSASSGGTTRGGSLIAEARWDPRVRVPDRDPESVGFGGEEAEHVRTPGVKVRVGEQFGGEEFGGGGEMGEVVGGQDCAQGRTGDARCAGIVREREGVAPGGG
ncbi:hypothetical protein GCM10023084_19120 [Streptomyces lacrimifluminis]|uniref:Uncharacterized protein n=1 Tax=Streptomyces lacrimifluminis TaxID=1500077 RepID=A0A917KDJ0_9ACTN|nr:hypothetical protein GCM10012282_03490 [Streptomyces lacrimifluminis]